MRKFGKYEKMRKSAILQTYVTSILCLALCVTMFFGTSMAWFSDTAESSGNQMYVGTLEIKLEHATFKGGAQQGTNDEMVDVTTKDYKILKSGKEDENGIRWEPGYTAVEKFRLTELGDLAFGYQLGIAYTFADGVSAQKSIAEHITVWNYLGDDAETITELPKDFAELTKAGWEEVGTLYEVITEHRTVFEGGMDKAAVTAIQKDAEGNPVLDNKEVSVPAEAYHLIALHMDEDFDGIYEAATTEAEAKTVMGQTMEGITIKLVATQKHSEQDAFDNTYDAELPYGDEEENKFTLVSEVQDLKDALAAGKNVVLNADIDMDRERVDIPENKAVVIDLNGHTLTSMDGGAANNDNMAVYVNRGAKLTLNDTAGGGEIVSSCYGVYVMPGATFVMNGGTLNVSGNGEYDQAVVVFNGKFVMNGGTINAHVGVVASDAYKKSDNTLPNCEITIANDCVINTVATSSEPADLDVVIDNAQDVAVDAPESVKICIDWNGTEKT